MLLGRLGLGCKQPHLLQLNIIKVIKCLKIHADFVPAWLWPRCICCESPLRMVRELEAVISRSLKGVALGGFVSAFGSPAFYGMKTLQKENATRWSYTPWGSLWLWVASPSQWLGNLVFGLVWKCRCVVLENKAASGIARWGKVCSAAGFHAPVYKVCPVILRNYLLCRLSFESSGLSFSGR